MTNLRNRLRAGLSTIKGDDTRGESDEDYDDFDDGGEQDYEGGDDLLGGVAASARHHNGGNHHGQSYDSGDDAALDSAWLEQFDLISSASNSTAPEQLPSHIVHGNEEDSDDEDNSFNLIGSTRNLFLGKKNDAPSDKRNSNRPSSSSRKSQSRRKPVVTKPERKGRGGWRMPNFKLPNLKAARKRRNANLSRLWNMLYTFIHASALGSNGAGSWGGVMFFILPVIPLFFLIRGFNPITYLIILAMSAPLLLYIYASMPVLYAWLFTNGLRFLGPLNGYPFFVDSLSINPHILDWNLVVHVVVRNARFGNPPGFPFDDFIVAHRLDFEVTVSFEHLFNLITQRRVPTPISVAKDFELSALFKFSHIEVEGVMCNFQMYEGKFNITEFTRILALGDTTRALKGRPHPNELRVQVVRAKKLQSHRLKSKADPYVVVRVRHQQKTTKTQAATLEPMWNEEMWFEHDDPSVVIEVSVYDRDAPDGSQMYLIGHWCMTSKYLICKPRFCWHDDTDFKVLNKKDGSYGFRGWVPLASKGWKEMGARGEIQLEISWRYTPEENLKERYVPIKEYSALEQLTQSSYEDKMRFGDWARVRHWLRREPYLFDVERFTIRDVSFYLQDLFLGHKGKAEGLIQSGGRAKDADCIKISKMEFQKRFRPKKNTNDPGITTYEVFINFFAGLGPKFARSGKLGGAVMQVMAGGASNITSQVKSLLLGRFDRTKLPAAKRGIMRIGTQAKSGFEVLHRKHTQNPRNERQFKFAVTAQDSDFILDTVELNGYMDRCTHPQRYAISDDELLRYATRKGKFKTKYFELKGGTLFFRKHREAPAGVTYNSTYKVEVASVSSAILVVDKGELILNRQDDEHVVRLRMPTKAKLEKAEKQRESVSANNRRRASSSLSVDTNSSVMERRMSAFGAHNPPLEAWFQQLKDRGVPCMVVDNVPDLM